MRVTSESRQGGAAETLRGYGVALLAMAVAALLTSLIRAITGVQHAIAAYLAAILFTGWYTGMGPVILALVLAFVLDVWVPLPGAELIGWNFGLRELWFLVFAGAAGWFGAVRRRVTAELQASRDRLETEVALRTSELSRTKAYLDEAQRLTHVGSWALPLDSPENLSWSEELYRILEVDPATTRPHIDVVHARVHPADQARRQAVVSRLVSTGEGFVVHYRLIRADGTVRFIRSVARTWVGAGGETVGYVGALMDVTESRRNARALRRAREGMLHERFAATLAERNRIAREMHDTLLQGFTGVALQLAAVANRATGSPVAGDLRQVIGQTQRTLADARDAILDLRVPTHGSLSDELRAVVSEVLCAAGLTLEFRSRGAARPLDPEIEVAIMGVAREAAINAAKHSGGRGLTMALKYGSRAVHLHVRDDGRGFAVPPETGPSNGHWGILGMRERAAGVGGRLRIRSGKERGTLVILVVPSIVPPTPRTPG